MNMLYFQYLETTFFAQYLVFLMLNTIYLGFLVLSMPLLYILNFFYVAAIRASAKNHAQSTSLVHISTLYECACQQ